MHFKLEIHSRNRRGDKDGSILFYSYPTQQFILQGKFLLRQVKYPTSISFTESRQQSKGKSGKVEQKANDNNENDYLSLSLKLRIEKGK